MTREQMVTEFGEPGVENPRVVDLIKVDAAAREVVLVMVERRPWGADPRQFAQIEEKINRYLGYVLEGFLVQHHPEYEGLATRVRLDCVEEPHGEALRFVEAARHAIRTHGLDLIVNVTPPAGSESAGT